MTKNGIEVLFPFEDVYECQKAYIEKTIQALQGPEMDPDPLSALLNS